MKRITIRAFMAFSISVSILIISSVLYTHKSEAVDDVTPPEVVSLVFDKTTINTELATDTLSITLNLTDDISGAGGDSQVRVEPVSGVGQFHDFYPLTLTSGTSLDGTFEGTVTFPHGAALGEWRVTQVLLFDEVGNNVVYDYDQLVTIVDANNLSFTNEALVQDVTAPELSSFQYTSASVDTTSGDDSITLNIEATDDLSGVGGDTQVAVAPVSGVDQSATFIPFTLTSGDSTDGVFTATITLPMGSASGEWRVTYIMLYDELGNYRWIDYSELIDDFGSDLSFMNIASVQDVTGPEISSINITPTEFDTSDGPVELTIELGLTDDLVGVGGDTQVRIAPLISTQLYDFYPMTLDSGTEQDGIFTATVTLPQYSKQGLWTVSYVMLQDTLGNTTSYDADQLNALPGIETPILINKALADEVEIEVDWTLNSDIASVTFSEGTIVTKSGDGLFAFYRMVSEDFDIKQIGGFNKFINSVNSKKDEVLGFCDEEENCADSGVNSSDHSGDPMLALRVGIPGLNIQFSKPVTIRLTMDEALLGKTIKIQTFLEGGNKWDSQGGCLVQLVNNVPSCTFQTTHASFFTASQVTENAGVPDTGLGFDPDLR